MDACPLLLFCCLAAAAAPLRPSCSSHLFGPGTTLFIAHRALQTSIHCCVATLQNEDNWPDPDPAAASYEKDECNANDLAARRDSGGGRGSKVQKQERGHPVRPRALARNKDTGKGRTGSCKQRLSKPPPGAAEAARWCSPFATPHAHRSAPGGAAIKSWILLVPQSRTDMQLQPHSMQATLGCSPIPDETLCCCVRFHPLYHSDITQKLLLVVELVTPKIQRVETALDCPIRCFSVYYESPTSQRPQATACGNGRAVARRVV